MRDNGLWLIDWWKLGTLVAFIGIMAIIWKVGWLVMYDWGWWWISPVGIAALLLWGWLTDRRAARQRGRPGRSEEP